MSTRFSPMFDIQTSAPGQVRLSGRLDAAQAGAAQAALDLAQGVVTLDCSALEYIASAGLGVLLKTQKRLKAAGGGLRLTGLNAHVFDVFAYAGFDRVFEIDRAR
jgi:anti-sigma B factor antagonist